MATIEVGEGDGTMPSHRRKARQTFCTMCCRVSYGGGMGNGFVAKDINAGFTAELLAESIVDWLERQTTLDLTGQQLIAASNAANDYLANAFLKLVGPVKADGVTTKRVKGPYLIIVPHWCEMHRPDLRLLDFKARCRMPLPDDPARY